MKNDNQDSTLVDKNFDKNENLETGKIKRTDINVLLNRVRLDEKKTFQKRIFLSLFLATLISVLTVCFII